MNARNAHNRLTNARLHLFARCVHLQTVAAKLCRISPHRTTRRLDRLVKDGRLIRHGERKSAWYERGQKI
jgi:hypothetical protein